MRILTITLSLLLLLPGLETVGSGAGPGVSEAGARSKRRRKKRRRTRRPKRVRPKRAAGPQTWHDRWVIKIYGAGVLGRLRGMGVTAKVFWYANQNAAAGIKRMAKGKHEDGFFLLNKAYRLIKSPNILYYLARANEAIGRLLRSREQYEAFLETAPRWTLTVVSAKLQNTARRQLADLQRKLVPIRLEVTVKGTMLFLDGRLRGQSPFAKPFWVRPGRAVRIVLLRDGHRRVEKTLLYKAGAAEQRIHLKMLTNADAVLRDKRFQELKRRKAEEKRRRLVIQRRLRLEQEAVRRRRARRQKALRISGWSGLTAGMVSLVLGTVFAIVGEQEFNKTIGVAVNTPWPDVKSNFRRSQQFRTIAYATLGTGASLAIAGAVLVYLGHRRSSRESAERPGAKAKLLDRLRIVPTVGPRSTGITAALRF